jgi:RNA polymerase sigma factor (sigma-70 family)
MTIALPLRAPPPIPQLPLSDDAALLAACRDRDPGAWERLMERYERLIYAISRQAGLDDDQTAEVFQQVCVTLLEHLDTIARPERLGAWLATTARRASWRLARRALATTALSAVDERALLADGDLEPGAVAESLELQRAVRRALAGLDARSQRLILLLYYQPEPLSYAEIALRLGIPEGSVGPTRARSLQKLQRALASLDG